MKKQKKAGKKKVRVAPQGVWGWKDIYDLLTVIWYYRVAVGGMMKESNHNEWQRPVLRRQRCALKKVEANLRQLVTRDGEKQ